MKPASEFFNMAFAIVLLFSISLQNSGSIQATTFQSVVTSLPQDTSTPIIRNAPVTPREFNGDLRSLPQIRDLNVQKHPLLSKPQYKGQVVTNPNGPASSTQIQAFALNMPSPTVNFAGLNLASNGSGWPPDPNGDVGPNHYIQAVNTSIGIFSKTGTLLTAFTFNSFWSGSNSGTACDTSNQGDPIVLYDPLGNRWVFADMAWTNMQTGPFYECFAVSKNNDPVSGGWWKYALRTDDSTHAYLADYPKLGIWLDGIYMSANEFSCSDSACGTAIYIGARAWALNLSQMESGATLQSFHADLFQTDVSGNPLYFGLLPSNLRGALPPSGTPDYFASLDLNSTSALDVWKFHVDWAAPTNNAFTGPTKVSIPSYIDASTTTIPEQGGENLDSLGDRLMMQNQYSNINGTESLWLTHTAGSSIGVTGIRWYQLNVTGGTIANSPVQSSLYRPDSNYRWMPSLAVDKMGDMAVGYSVSSSTMYPSIAYSGRLVTDTLNALGQGETTLIAGTGSQVGGSGRWGDYTAMTLDPVDDCTFWYTNEYYSTTSNNWQTRIGAFEYPSCTTFADVPSTYWAWQYIESIYTAGITSGCESSPLSLYCPDNTVTRAQMAIFLLRSIHGSSYTPPVATGTIFTDVPATYWAANWIDELAAERITSGCGGGNYCPDAPVTRAQMAIFLLCSEHGASYTPPPASGTMFSDVPATYWAASWIEQLGNEGITSGCGGGNYCPDSSVTRAQQAVFLQKTFHLSLP